MSEQDRGSQNAFLTGSLPRLFARTALPIVLVTSTNGLLALVDAYFLGAYVGPEALAAVTLTFPVFMLLVALSSLVSTGMASQLARLLGAGEIERARAVFVGAHGLALAMCAVLITLFALGGTALIGWLSHGSARLAEMGYGYISVLIWCSPLMFLLSINGDALRSEGRIGFMASASLMTSLANAVMNYVLIVQMDFGVRGSAVGTVLAQFVAFSIVIAYRAHRRAPLGLAIQGLDRWRSSWRRILALGAPQSLSFIGISLSATAVIYSVQSWAGASYAPTVAAYGIITRLMTFAFLPLLGLNMATQTIVGNNFGAGIWHRSDAGLRFGLTLALAYCAAFEAALMLSSRRIGLAFVDDAATVAEIARILPMTLAAYFTVGPIMLLSGYFQAIGDAGRALLFSVARTYFLAIPLTIALPYLAGERGIWLASPVSDLSMVLIAAVVLARSRRATGLGWGLFRASGPAAAGVTAKA